MLTQRYFSRHLRRLATSLVIADVLAPVSSILFTTWPPVPTSIGTALSFGLHPVPKTPS
jgi:hypothetical protein